MKYGTFVGVSLSLRKVVVNKIPVTLDDFCARNKIDDPNYVWGPLEEYFAGDSDQALKMGQGLKVTLSTALSKHPKYKNFIKKGYLPSRRELDLCILRYTGWGYKSKEDKNVFN